MTRSPHCARVGLALAAVALELALPAGPARADTTTGQISGWMSLGPGATVLPSGSMGEMLAERPGSREEQPTVVGSAPIAADGTYTITDLPPGAYLLTNLGPDAELWYPESSDPLHGSPITVQAGQTTYVGNMLDVTGTTITGAVTDTRGRPLAGAALSLVMRGPDGSSYTPSTALSQTTGANGGFELDDVPAGTWTLRLLQTPPGYRPSTGTVTTTGSGAITVDVALRRTGGRGPRGRGRRRARALGARRASPSVSRRAAGGRRR